MCKVTQPVENFHKSKSNKSGYSSYCAPCKVEANRQSGLRMVSADREKHLRARKNNHLKVTYGITIDEYDRKLEGQNGVCAICGKPESQSYRKLSVDHNHATNAVRGLLCYGCNRGIGSFRENPTSLHNAVVYLNNWY